MKIGQYVTISQENELPFDDPWRSIMGKLEKDNSVGVVTQIFGEEGCDTYQVVFLVNGEPCNPFLFLRHELEYAPVDLLSIIEVYKRVAARY